MTTLRSLTGAAALASVPFLVAPAAAQEAPQDPAGSPFAGLSFRSIGPAFMSGRIADIAVDHEDPSTWYVAVGCSGGCSDG